MTWLTQSADRWDAVFTEGEMRPRFLARLARARDAERVLDVGCATGSLAVALAHHGLDVTGVDINARFIAAARRKLPSATFEVGDMRTFRTKRRFDLVLCLGTTLAYAASNDQVVETLANLRSHLVPGGTLVLDVVNAIALLAEHPFEPVRRHRHTLAGEPLDAVIRHRVLAPTQRLTEQVTWTYRGQRRRDPEQSLRLFFPEEMRLLAVRAGLRDVRLRSAFGAEPRGLTGRRLITIARR